LLETVCPCRNSWRVRCPLLPVCSGLHKGANKEWGTNRNMGWLSVLVLQCNKPIAHCQRCFFFLPFYVFFFRASPWPKRRRLKIQKYVLFFLSFIFFLMYILSPRTLIMPPNGLPLINICIHLYLGNASGSRRG
jgi:hypothetical protein